MSPKFALKPGMFFKLKHAKDPKFKVHPFLPVHLTRASAAR